MENQFAFIETSKRNKQRLTKNSSLILLGFAIAFFPRLFSYFGIPSIIDFAHFAILPGICIIAVFTTRTRDKKQLGLVTQLVAGISFLLACMLASALLNKAGFINVVLQFLLEAEPFMLLAAMLAIPIAGERLKRFQYWLLGFALVNLLLALAQSILLPIGLYPRPDGGTLADNIGGVFGGGGGSAANYVSCTVSIYFSIYFFNQFKHLSLWVRVLPLLGALYQTQVSDSKQVFLAIAVGWGLLTITKIKRPLRLVIYASVGLIAVLSFRWALLNLDAAILAPYQNWIFRPIWGLDGLAAQTKFAAFRIIPTHFESPLNWLLGLGPGHTVTRIGGWIIKKYAGLLIPLGATIHPVSAEVWQWVGPKSYLPRESSLYFPLFTWVGIWGDTGLVGLGAYLYLCFLVWRNVCVDDFGRFMLLSTACFGCIITQMEEPGHMLTVACLLALRWQENREKQLQRVSPKLFNVFR